MSAMHLIEFPNKHAHKHGLVVVLEVPRESLGLPDYQMVVTDEHIRALERARVPFTYLSQSIQEGKQKI
jgi:hypothetical protein